MAGILYRKEQELVKLNCIVEVLLVANMNNPCQLQESILWFAVISRRLELCTTHIHGE